MPKPLQSTALMMFSEVERKRKHNREMAFVAKLMPAPLTEDQRMLDDLKMSGMKIGRS
jgi:hypothetical protein